MKKIVFILSVLFTFSCSNNDSENNSSDKIIGTWRHTKSTYIQNNSQQYDQLFESSCDIQNRFIIKKDGTFDKIRYSPNPELGSCILQTSSFTGEKIWAKSNTNQYVFQTISSNPNYDSETLIAVEANFEGNKMILKFIELQNENNPEDTAFYIETYERQ